MQPFLTSSYPHFEWIESRKSWKHVNLLNLQSLVKLQNNGSSVLEFYNWGTHTTQQREVWNERKGERCFKPKENELVTSLMHLRISFELSTSLQWFCLKFNRTCWMFTISPKIRYEESRWKEILMHLASTDQAHLVTKKASGSSSQHPFGGIFRFSARQFSILKNWGRATN